MKCIFTQSLIATLLVCPSLLAVMLSNGYCSAQTSPGQPTPSLDKSAEKSAAANPSPNSASQAEQEKKFQDTLTGATLKGHFTNSRDENGAAAKEDKYSITSVSKQQGDVWLFNVRIQYGTNDVSLPLPLRVVWAGDTPVITLDKFPVPGMGSFTARVMIFDNKYTGMWDGGDHGGLLYGNITKAAQTEHP